MATSRGDIRRVATEVREENGQWESDGLAFSVEEGAGVGLEPPVQVRGQRRTKR